MDRVFLDANVLFSAAYRAGSRLRELWTHTNVILLTSAYAIEEARRNLALSNPDCTGDFEVLVATIKAVPEATEGSLDPSIELAEKDRPILAAAISAKATHLLTGDNKHFGRLYGQTVGGVMILTPASYFMICNSTK